MTTITEPVPQTGYFTSTGRVGELQYALRSETSARLCGELGAVVLDSPTVTGRFGTIGRQLELARGFREMAFTSPEVEESTKFLYIVDPDAAHYVTHSTRVIQPSAKHQQAAVEEVLDDLKGQVSPEEITAYHHIQDVTRCVFVSTDLAAPEVQPTRTRPYGLLAYRALFRAAKMNNSTHVVAYMNAHTLRALGRLQINPVPLCGRTDYVIPPLGDITFEAYQPYVLEEMDHIHRIFEDAEYAAQFSKWGKLLAETELQIVSMRDM